MPCLIPSFNLRTTFPLLIRNNKKVGMIFLRGLLHADHPRQDIQLACYLLQVLSLFLVLTSFLVFGGFFYIVSESCAESRIISFKERRTKRAKCCTPLDKHQCIFKQGRVCSFPAREFVHPDLLMENSYQVYKILFRMLQVQDHFLFPVYQGLLRLELVDFLLLNPLLTTIHCEEYTVLCSNKKKFRFDMILR